MQGMHTCGLSGGWGAAYWVYNRRKSHKMQLQKPSDELSILILRESVLEVKLTRVHDWETHFVKATLMLRNERRV